MDKTEQSEAIAKRMLESLKLRMNKQWDELVTADRQLIADVLADAAVLQLVAMATPPMPDLQAALLEEKRHLDAQLANIESMEVSTARAFVWDAVRAVVQAGIVIAFAAV